MSEMLVEYAATRDRAVRDALVERHLPLVKYVARKMSSSLPSNVEVQDLVSWGCLGLLDAIEKFEPARGHQFSTYAVQRIRGEILDGLQRMEWAPKQVTSRVRAMRRASEAMAGALGREPTDVEIAREMTGEDGPAVSADDVRGWKVDSNRQRVKSTSGAVTDSADFSEGLGDFGQDADQEVAGEVAEICGRVAAAVASLDDRSEQVLLLYYRDSLTLREIAGRLGVSVSSATQTHTRLLSHIQSRLASYGAVA